MTLTFTHCGTTGKIFIFTKLVTRIIPVLPILVTQTVKNLSAMKETWVQTLGREDPPEKGMATHSIMLPGEFHGQRRLVGNNSPWGCKELDMTD